MKNWKEILAEEDIYSIIENSTIKPQIIFKDSISCGISAHAKERLENDHTLLEGKAVLNYLNLLRFRPISNLIAKTLHVTHQSPQIIILKDKKVVYTTSHHAINAATIVKYL